MGPCWTHGFAGSSARDCKVPRRCHQGDLALAPNSHTSITAGTGTPVLLFVCVLTFLHYAAAQMRGLILPLYAAAHGATATAVGFIVGAHMMVAAAGGR